jgi:hypothetical protein
MAYIGLLLSTVGLAFAACVTTAEARNLLSQRSYFGSWVMYGGIIASVATIASSALAEGKLRRYLLLGAVGLLCLYCFGFAEGV